MVVVFEASVAKRLCAVCRLPLSQYNKTDRCFHHKPENPAKITSQQKKLKLSEKKERRLAQLKTKGEKKQDQTLRLVAESHTADTLLKNVCETFEVEVELILGKSRKANIVEARHVAMYLMRRDLHLSFPKIAKILNRKDHTTAIHAVRKMELRFKQNEVV